MKKVTISFRLSGIIIAGFLLLVTSFISDAQTGGAIYETGPLMMRAKIYPVASALDNGKIISFGGRESGFVSCAYADTYDPSTNLFSESQMNFTHDFAAVAKLSDGRYFIAGGGKNSGVPAYATTEMYDQTTGTFSTTASMITARMMSAAVQLTTGKILIAGAWYNTTAASYGELYDPLTDIYTATGTLNQSRSQPILLPTTDGGAVMAGGTPSYGGTAFTSTEYYNPSSNVFENLNSELIPADAGWLLYPIYTRPIDDSRMSNGNYILLAYRSEPTLEFTLIEFNPSTKLFSELVTSAPLSDSLTDGGFYDLVLNRAGNIAYILGLKANSSPKEVCLVTVDLTTGNSYYPPSSYTLLPQEHLAPSMTYINSTGKILLQGISSAPDNFSATNKTYLLTPQLTVGTAETRDNSAITIRYYPNPSSGLLTVKVENVKTEIFTLAIYNVMGELVRSENVKGNMQHINVSNLSNGIYTAEIKTKGWSERQKLIIQK